MTIGEHPDGCFLGDHGPGIPAVERDRIFDSGFSTKPDGTGFGLDIVTQVVNAHNWEVSVTERTDGGERFEFTGVRIGPSSRNHRVRRGGSRHLERGVPNPLTGSDE